MQTRINGSLVPWFGAKRSIAKHIIGALGAHSAYIEPFCGSMAVLLNKPRSRTEVVNDLHGDIINLARVIADKNIGPIFYRSVRRRLYDERLLEEARLHLDLFDEPPINWLEKDPEAAWVRAEAFFCASWIGRAGEVGLENDRSFDSMGVRYSAGGGDNARRLQTAVQSIPHFRRRLQGVQITQRDGVEMLESYTKLDRPGNAIYVDPPYLVKSQRYKHDFTGLPQHMRLAEALNQYQRARVVVSYYDEPRLEQMYPPDKWTKLVITIPKRLASPSTATPVAREVLLINNVTQGAGNAIVESDQTGEGAEDSGAAETDGGGVAAGGAGAEEAAAGVGCGKEGAQSQG